MNEETTTRDSTISDAKPALSQAERDILRIWRKLFKIEDMDVQSDFFDLGGHSFLLAKLQIAMKKEFNVRLTAAEVFRQPTIAALAAWLERAQSGTKLAADPQSDAPTHDPRIIPIQPSGASRPVFVLSQSLIFRTLAAEMEPNQPVYAVQMLEEDLVAMGSASFEDLVNFYVRLIREVQPSGPYRLAGWCVSGWIAYGVARQLETQGERIEMLIVIDAWAPGYWSSQSRMRRRLALAIYGVRRSLWAARRLRQTNASQSETYIQRSLHGVTATIQKLVARLDQRRILAEMREIEELGRNNHLQHTAGDAALTGALQGKILLFRSEEEPTGPLLSLDMGWSRMLGRSVQVEVLPGDHHEIFNLPGARVMAIRAREILGASETPAYSPVHVSDTLDTPDTLRAERPTLEIQPVVEHVPLAKV